MLAAASLTETFTTLAQDFEADHPGVKVKLSFDSSATLAEQVTQGAPADVLATADEATMQTVVDAQAAHGAPASSPPTTSRWSCHPATRPASRSSPTSTSPA